MPCWNDSHSLRRMDASAQPTQNELTNWNGTALLQQEKDEESSRHIHILVRWLEGIMEYKREGEL